MISPMLRRWMRIHRGIVRSVPTLPLTDVKYGKLLLDPSGDCILLEDGTFYLMKEPSGVFTDILQEETSGDTLTDYNNDTLIENIA